MREIVRKREYAVKRRELAKEMKRGKREREIWRQIILTEPKFYLSSNGDQEEEFDFDAIKKISFITLTLTWTYLEDKFAQDLNRLLRTISLIQLMATLGKSFFSMHVNFLVQRVGQVNFLGLLDACEKTLPEKDFLVSEKN